MFLWHRYDTDGNALTPGDRLRIGSNLARMMLEDGEPRYAVRVAQGLRPLADAPATSSADRREFLRLWARCAAAAPAYQEAVTAVERTLALTSEPCERAELEALLAEQHYFSGEIDRAAGPELGSEEEL